MDDKTRLDEAVRLHQAGRLDEAARILIELTRKSPANGAAQGALGAVRLQQGDMRGALAAFDAALAADPNQAHVLLNKGLALRAAQRLDEALASFDAALARAPAFAPALLQRGYVLMQCERPNEALASFDKVIALAPDNVAAWLNAGIALQRLGEPEAALTRFTRVTVLAPNLADGHQNCGVMLHTLKRPREALRCFERSAALAPQRAEARFGKGAALAALEQFAPAAEAFAEAIRLKPTYAEAYAHRGGALAKLERWDDALASLDRASEIDPNLEFVLGERLHLQLKLCDWRGAEERAALIMSRIEAGKMAATPFSVATTWSKPIDQWRAARVHAQRVFNTPPAHAPGPYRHERIRLGYFSSDYFDHATAFLIADMIARHDRAQFEVIAYSFGPQKRDAMNARLRRVFDDFIDVETKSDREIAALARAREIDIAIDLKGLTEHARTGVFAQRAAPAQIAFLGYPGTMGAPFIDYAIADTMLIPEQEREFYTEKIIYLPDTYQPTDQTRTRGEAPSRAVLGLPENGFVFCGFNNSFKITAPVFDIWMRLLRAVDGAVLWLLESNSRMTENLRTEAQARGIEPSRLIFAPRAPMAQHLARQRAADLFLDTLPCSAHTTASDALFAGLPVLTCEGANFAGRVAASVLHAAGLPELITSSLEEYETLALRFAREAVALAALRTKLEAARTSAPLFDAARFTRHIEAAYREVWKRGQQGLAPDHITIVPQ